MDWDGAAAVALIALAFYVVRRVSRFALCGIVIVAAFAAVSARAAAGRTLEWLVMLVGIAASCVGLLFVRFMLIRSVSLQLLARADQMAPGSFDDDIAGRVRDLRTHRLVQHAGGINRLTRFGHAVSALVAAAYAAIGMTA